MIGVVDWWAGPGPATCMHARMHELRGVHVSLFGVALEMEHWRGLPSQACLPWPLLPRGPFPPARPPAALYNLLNITGWDAYPDCWVFPQPAISLVFEDTTHLIAFAADEDDKSAGRTVANAWCQ